MDQLKPSGKRGISSPSALRHDAYLAGTMESVLYGRQSHQRRSYGITRPFNAENTGLGLAIVRLHCIERNTPASLKQMGCIRIHLILFILSPLSRHIDFSGDIMTPKRTPKSPRGRFSRAACYFVFNLPTWRLLGPFLVLLTIPHMN